MLPDLEKTARDRRSGVLKFVKSQNSKLVSNFSYRLSVGALGCLPVIGVASFHVSARSRVAV